MGNAPAGAREALDMVCRWLEIEARSGHQDSLSA